jgi:hypothetical protein
VVERDDWPRDLLGEKCLHLESILGGVVLLCFPSCPCVSFLHVLLVSANVRERESERERE